MRVEHVWTAVVGCLQTIFFGRYGSITSRESVYRPIRGEERRGRLSLAGIAPAARVKQSDESRRAELWTFLLVHALLVAVFVLFLFSFSSLVFVFPSCARAATVAACLVSPCLAFRNRSRRGGRRKMIWRGKTGRKTSGSTVWPVSRRRRRRTIAP